MTVTGHPSYHHCHPSHHHCYPVPVTPPVTVTSHCQIIPSSHHRAILPVPSHCPFTPLSFHPTILPSHYPSIPLSFHLTILPSHYPTIPPPQSPSPISPSHQSTCTAVLTTGDLPAPIAQTGERWIAERTLSRARYSALARLSPAMARCWFTTL